MAAYENTGKWIGQKGKLYDHYMDMPVTFVCWGHNLTRHALFHAVLYRCDPKYGAPWDKCNLACNESVWMIPGTVEV